MCRLLCGCGRGCSAPLGKRGGRGGARRPGGRARARPVPSETSKPSPSEAAPPAFPATVGELPAAPGPPAPAGVRALDVSGSAGCAVEPPAAVFFTCVFKQLLGLGLAQTWQIKFWTFIPLTDIPDTIPGTNLTLLLSTSHLQVSRQISIRSISFFLKDFIHF